MSARGGASILNRINNKCRIIEDKPRRRWREVLPDSRRWRQERYERLRAAREAKGWKL